VLLQVPDPMWDYCFSLALASTIYTVEFYKSKSELEIFSGTG
jgi:hypothetical protein